MALSVCFIYLLMPITGNVGQKTETRCGPSISAVLRTPLEDRSQETKSIDRSSFKIETTQRTLSVRNDCRELGMTRLAFGLGAAVIVIIGSVAVMMIFRPELKQADVASTSKDDKS